MARIASDGKVTLKGNSYLVTDLVKDLIRLSGSIAAEFFTSTKLSVPRAIRIKTLKDLLREHVAQTRVARAALADELSYRLSLFEHFGDTQLVNLLEFYNTKGELSTSYLTNIWENILLYLFEKRISEDDLYQLVMLAQNAAKKRNVVDTKEFNSALNMVFYDYVGEIDGLKQEDFRPVVYRGSTLTELREIGVKYQVSVPKRLKKKELLAIMLKELADRKELTSDLETQLKTKNIILLERYCKDNDIKVSTELKKEEIIEYILANAKETKAAYYAPSSSAVYEQLDQVAQAAPKPVVKEKTVKEEPVKVKEEPVVKVVEEKIVPPVTRDEPKVVKQAVVSGEVFDYNQKLDRIILELERLNLNSEIIYKRLLAFDTQKVSQYPTAVPVVVTTQAPATKETEEPKKKKKRPLLKIILIIIDIILILLALIFIIALIGYFYPDLGGIKEINDFVNNIRIGNRGLVDHIHAFADWVRGIR